MHAVHAAFSHCNWTDRGAYLLQAIQKQLRTCCGASICCRKSCQRQHQPQPQQHATTTTTAAKKENEKEKQKPKLKLKKTTPALWLAVCDLYRLQVAAHETGQRSRNTPPLPSYAYPYLYPYFYSCLNCNCNPHSNLSCSTVKGRNSLSSPSSLASASFS